ncbi:hypothetical protein YC2023_022061 [Brassica napus]
MEMMKNKGVQRLASALEPPPPPLLFPIDLKASSIDIGRLMSRSSKFRLEITFEAHKAYREESTIQTWSSKYGEKEPPDTRAAMKCAKRLEIKDRKGDGKKSANRGTILEL